MRAALGCLVALLVWGCGRAEEPVSVPPSVTPSDALERPVRSPYRVAVISDLNGAYGSTEYGEAVHAAVDQLLSLHPNLVLSTGDMVAGQRRGVDHAAMWQGFHAAVSDRLASASIPFAVTPGNHDGSGYAAWTAERTEFVQQWSGRRPEVAMVDEAEYPLRYSFVAGPAFFISLDATVIGEMQPEQMRWLERQLRRAPRETVVVFGHLPLHPFAQGRERETLGDTRLESLLLRYGVDVFVSGHHHAYYPGRRGPLRLVSTACLGSGPRPLLGVDQASERSILLFELEESGIGSLEAFGGAHFDEPIRREDLPASVGTEERQIQRDDLPSASPELPPRS
ncbi:MAG: metallophosphoesterase [Sandaracinaceae bacterium]